MTTEMKSLTLVCCLFILLASGCDRKQEDPATRYGDALINAYQGSKNAAEQANLDAIRKTIGAYHAANGAYPESLQDVKGLLGSPIDLSGFDYDPLTGSVTPKPQK